MHESEAIELKHESVTGTQEEEHQQIKIILKLKPFTSVAQNLDKSFKTKSKLKSHKIQKERYTCKMCGEIFRKEKYLLKCTIAHLRQINNDQRKFITYMSNPQPTDPQALEFKNFFVQIF